MQTVCIGKVQTRGVSRAVFSSHSWDFSSTRLHGVHGASQDITRLHGGAALHGIPRDSSAALELLSVHCASLELHSQVSVHRASPLSSDFSYTAILVTALSYSFRYRIFFEQLCFSIDLAISSLLQLMQLKNPQKVSRTGKLYAISLHRQVQARGVLGPFFSAYIQNFGYRPSAARRSRRFTGHHGAPQGLTGFMAAQHFTAQPGLATRPISVTALATALVTRFSSNSYVFLQIQLFHLSCS